MNRGTTRVAYRMGKILLMLSTSSQNTLILVKMPCVCSLCQSLDMFVEHVHIRLEHEKAPECNADKEESAP